MTEDRANLLTWVASAILTCLLYALAFYLQFGAPIEAAYDVNNWRIWKQHIAKTTPSPKVLLIGGSGTLFGMDSAYLEQRLGIPVVNHGLHGGMPLDWLLDVSLKYVNNNDIVVLSLEWPYLLEDYTITNSWVADQVMAWNADYFHEMDLHRKLEFITSISPATVLSHLGARIQSVFRKFPRRRTYDEVEVLNTYDRESTSQTAFRYSYLNMNRRGDMLRACGQTGSAFRETNYSIDPTSDLNTTSIEYLGRVVKNIETSGTRVFLVATPILINRTTESEWFRNKLIYFHNELRRKGFHILGGPFDYRFSADAFYNTEYHLECSYARQRASILANQLGFVAARAAMEPP